MYKITKVIHFCYGHRLLDYKGPCRFLHGHNAKAEIELTSDTLNPLGMVMDFAKVKEHIQGWVDSVLDHKMLLNEKDPIVPQLKTLKEPFVALPQNPTAETLAQMIFDEARRAGFPVSQVTLWETPNSFATYRG